MYVLKLLSFYISKIHMWLLTKKIKKDHKKLLKAINDSNKKYGGR